MVFQGTSQTMATLKNLVNKGVKVELGIPYELWDEPSVEVSDMKKQVGYAWLTYCVNEGDFSAAMKPKLKKSLLIIIYELF